MRVGFEGVSESRCQVVNVKNRIGEMVEDVAQLIR